MYSENTPHAGGPNPKKYAQAQRRMLTVASKIDKINERLLKNQHIKFKDSEKDIESGHFVKDSEYYIDADSIAAFVTFEYCESMARCVEDYATYNEFFLLSKFYFPAPLKLNNRVIQVVQAPGPEEVNFENLEVSSLSKFLRRLRTAFVALLLMVISFVAILQAANYKSQQQSQIPVLSYCSSEIPNLYLNSSTKISSSSISLARPIDADVSKLDDQCKALIPNTFYGVYGINGDYTNPIGKYDVKTCTKFSHTEGKNQTNLCPKLGESPFCPCFSLTSVEQCSTIACDKYPNGPACHHFPA